MNNHKNKNLYVQISAGRGPAECCWVVAQLLSYLLKECVALKLDSKVVERQLGPENGTLYSALIEVRGNDAAVKIEEWEGVIQWVGKSQFRKYHKRKNWFVGIAFFESETSASPGMHELEFQTFRASGPGGQHRNKVETAVRVTHKLTGLTASATESRSQHQNKQLAVKKLEEVFEKSLLDQQKKQIEEQWQQHLSLERGNAVKVFEGKGFVLRK